MKKDLFDKLVQSLEQAVKIHRGEAKPSRQFVVKSDDVRAIRAKLHKSQAEFARMIGVSLNTLQNREQGRRRPVGPARALLLVAARSPRTVERALSRATRRGA
ncbi:MAG TPA: NadS family protein [Thermoanaerobaculia bacterium]|nr:NadS family protein [Thermoanaerobaculia bacterium]